MSISISCIATIYYEKSLRAIEKTLQNVPGISKIYWFSNIKLPTDLWHGYQIINIPIKPFDQNQNFNEAYSFLTLKQIPRIIDTDYNLIVQYDGYAVNKSSWTDDFLKYDYIGAVVKWFPKRQNVGNGGFSLRSRKLYQAIKTLDIKYQTKDLLKFKIKPHKLFKDKFNGKKGLSIPEDYILSVLYQPFLEKEYGIRFAPEEIADQFSIESKVESKWVGRSLGFHGPIMNNLYNSVFFSKFTTKKK